MTLRRGIAVFGVPASLAILTALWIRHWAPSPGVRQPPADEAPGGLPANDSPLPEAPPPGGIPIAGRVFGPDLQGIPGIEVACGEETAVSGADGGFQFPSALRYGKRALVARKDGAAIASWDGVTVGGDEPESSGGPPPEGGGAGLRPDRIRWTINLGASSTGGIGSSSPGPIELKGVAVEDWGRSGEILVDGTTTLPDGAHLQTTIFFEGERLLSATEDTLAQGGLFRARIRFPDEFKIFSAAYELQLLFAVKLEDPRDVERWRKERADLDWGEDRELVAVRKIYIGDPSEELDENRRIESGFREILDGIEGLQKILLSRCRRLRGLARNWDPAILEAQRDLEAGPLEPKTLDAAGRFDSGAWREFMDRGFRPEVFRLMRLHEERKQGKFRSADFLLTEVLKRLLLLSRIESSLVYQAWGLDIHPNDFYLDEERPEGDETIILQILKKELGLLDRFRNLTAPKGDGGGAEE